MTRVLGRKRNSIREGKKDPPHFSGKGFCPLGHEMSRDLSVILNFEICWVSLFPLFLFMALGAVIQAANGDGAAGAADGGGAAIGGGAADGGHTAGGAGRPQASGPQAAAANAPMGPQPPQGAPPHGNVVVGLGLGEISEGEGVEVDWPPRIELGEMYDGGDEREPQRDDGGEHVGGFSSPIGVGYR